MAVSSRVLALLTGAAMLPAASARAQSDWCRDEERSRGREERYCEVREHTLSGGTRLSVDARPNGGIEVLAWERGDIRLEAKVVAQAETEAEAREIAAQVQIDTSNTVR